jgi:hypothetical protein
MCPDALRMRYFEDGRSAHMSETPKPQVISGPKKMGDGKYCVIQDPAGAVAALIDSGEKQG